MKPYISENAIEITMPVYHRLAPKELLLRCAYAQTKTQIKAYAAAFRKQCPNQVFISKERPPLAVVSAESAFNLGSAEQLKVTPSELCFNANSLAIEQKIIFAEMLKEGVGHLLGIKFKQLKKFEKRPSNTIKMNRE